ncbi:MAG: hypothetical protein KC800_10170 [Candidatus Eremiobacteraeota bacterium]|nr:hypothetical protein [Candidatus Eremiobacteraeota bacterium]
MRGVLPAIGFVILVWAIWGRAGDDTLLKVYGGLGQPAEDALTTAGFECRQEGAILTVGGNDRAKCLRVLLQALTDKTVEESVILENIRNQNGRPDWEENVYRRKFIVYNEDGSLKGWMEDQSDYNWVYQPFDINAVKSGPKAGYLPKPNVNLLQEETSLALVRMSKERLKASISYLDPELVVGEIPASWSDYPELLPEIDFPELTTNSQAAEKLDNMARFDISSIKGLNRESTSPGAANVVPLAQSNGVSQGQTSVAMCLNALLGTELTDMDIDRHYGFQLLRALQTESRVAGYEWRDAGDLSWSKWSLIDTKVNREGLPVIVALNGPEFSPSGRGNIVTVVKTTPDTVTYADPADGQLKITDKQNMVDAQSHPDGNFIFVADRVATGQL